MSGIYDAVILVSFGGPDGPDDVIPFLENVLRGRNVPRERLLEVAEHYYHFGGRSPINDQNRALIAALKSELAARGPDLPVYWGNRNWHPFLADTLREMADAGVRRAAAFVTSAFSSYSGCRQYRENLAEASLPLGDRAPQIDKLRVFFNHPGFVGPMADNLAASLERFPSGERASTPVLFTAHSIPESMAAGCNYLPQLQEACRLVASAAGAGPWELVFQSRSGPPTQPWLEPDVGDRIRQLHAGGMERVVVAPIGFVSDHMEVLYDLDTEVADLCRSLGVRLERAATVGTAPRFVAMIRDLVAERHFGSSERAALGLLPASHDVCPLDCCPAPRRPAGPGAPAGRPSDAPRGPAS